MVENVYCELCNSIIRKLNSCPTKPNFAENTFYENLFELFMVFSSAFPYFLVFLIFISSLLTKTTRGFFITFLVFFQNFTCEAIKYIYEDPRPEGSCGKGYGFPSSHASFTAALFIWLFLESYFLKKNSLFKKWGLYTLLRNSFFAFSPFILYSRIYLNYHSLEQIIYGMIYGSSFSIVLFIYVVKNIIKPDFLPKSYSQHKEENFLISLFKTYDFKNNLMDQTHLDNQKTKLEGIRKTVENVKTNLKAKKDNLEGKINELKNKGYGDPIKIN